MFKITSARFQEVLHVPHLVMKKHPKNRFSRSLILIVGILLLSSICVYFLIQLQSIKHVSPLTKAKEFQRICSQTKQKELCYAEQFARLTKANPIQTTLATLASLKSVDTSTQFCHLIAHKIAVVEVRKDPQHWLDVLDSVDLQGCSRGFFHGVIEGYSGYDTDFSLTSKTIPPLCQQVAKHLQDKEKQQNSIQSCLHAIGHTLLVQEQANIEDAVKICSSLTKSYRHECYSGVFMENMNKENLFVHGLGERVVWNTESITQQAHVCSSFLGEAGSVCWEDQGEMFGSLSNGSSDELHRLCQQAPLQENRGKCEMKGSGFIGFRIAAGAFSRANLPQLCKSFIANDVTMKQCLRQVVFYIVNASSTYEETAKAFCEEINTGNRDYCREQIVTAHSEFTSTQALDTTL